MSKNDLAEREAAWMALFALGYRNGA
eukprot:COSAG01_NODE_23979_length_795_cov_0.672414_1_plen_25_part_10